MPYNVHEDPNDYTESGLLSVCQTLGAECLEAIWECAYAFRFKIVLTFTAVTVGSLVWLLQKRRQQYEGAYALLCQASRRRLSAMRRGSWSLLEQNELDDSRADNSKVLRREKLVSMEEASSIKSRESSGSCRGRTTRGSESRENSPERLSSNDSKRSGWNQSGAFARRVESLNSPERLSSDDSKRSSWNQSGAFVRRVKSLPLPEPSDEVEVCQLQGSGVSGFHQLRHATSETVGVNATSLRRRSIVVARCNIRT